MSYNIDMLPLYHVIFNILSSMIHLRSRRCLRFLHRFIQLPMRFIACCVPLTGADPGGSLGSRDPLQKYIREAKGMMYWYKNTLKCIIS